MKISKSKYSAGVYTCENGFNITCGYSPTQALNRMFNLLYWQMGLKRPKSWYEKLLGWLIFNNE